MTREHLEAELQELARLARRNGRAHRLYVWWHEQMNDRLDAWEDIVHAPVAPGGAG